MIISLILFGIVILLLVTRLLFPQNPEGRPPGNVECQFKSGLTGKFFQALENQGFGRPGTWKIRDFGGPYCWPFTGNWLLLRRLARKLGGQHLAFLELSQQYDSNVIAIRLGASDIIIVSGHEEIQKVLHSEEYDGRPWNEFIKLRNMGARNGITMCDGPEWKDMRAWVVRTLRTIGFGRKEMSDLIKEELEAVLVELDGGGVRRLKPVIGPAVINVLWILVTGRRLCEGPRLQFFLELMDKRARAFDMAGGLLSTFPWIRYILPEYSGYNLLTTLNDQMKIFLMGTINEHKKKYVPGKGDDLIDMFLHEMYSGKGAAGGFTEEQLIMIIMDLFIAGSVTTTTTLDFLYLNMTINQNVQRRLHEEIDNMIDPERLPELKDKPKMPYTRAIMTESQRMSVVAPIIGPRRVLRESKLLGYTIQKETTVLLNIWSIHMNPKYYPDPDSFKPERFMQNGTYVSDERLIFFGEGRRRCPGEALARSALFLLFTGIMQRFRLLPVPGQEPPTLVRVPGITISPKPYEVLLVPRRATSAGDLAN